VLILGTPGSKGITQHKALAKNIYIFIFPVIPGILLVEKFYTIWRRLTYFVAKWDDASVIGK
jgi:hypothetical protein